MSSKTRISIVVPNWNGEDTILDTLRSINNQTLRPDDVIVVDNGSVDNSVRLIEKNYPSVSVVSLSKNTGFAGGVNSGIQFAFINGSDAIGLLNNDAVAHKNWLRELSVSLFEREANGIITCKLLKDDKKSIDSTGDTYTSWGLPYPRGRNSLDKKQYDKKEEVFGASGGASLYRTKMLKEIGLFDEKYFAYLEDVDISFRAQLAGWKVVYAPKAVAYHKIGATSSKIKGFTTYHYIKNLPMLFWKNVPWKFVPRMFPRLFFAYWMIMIKTLLLGPNRWSAIKGHTVWLKNIPHTFRKRSRIQKNKKVSDDYIWSITTHHLPPNARSLRKLRNFLKFETIIKTKR